MAEAFATPKAPKWVDREWRVPSNARRESSDDSKLNPAAIARTYWNVATQPRSAWTREVELRPYVEKF